MYGRRASTVWSENLKSAKIQNILLAHIQRLTTKMFDGVSGYSKVDMQTN